MFEPSVDGTQTYFVNGSDLIAENIGVLDRATLPRLHKDHNGIGLTLEVLCSPKRGYDGQGRIPIANVILYDDASPRLFNFVAHCRVKIDVHNSATCDLPRHQKFSEST
jgi:hypothetical protein